MISLLKHRLFVRLSILTVLTLSLSLLTRSEAGLPSGDPGQLVQSQIQAQVPTLKVQTQADAPIQITAPRLVSWDGQKAEIAFEVKNLSNKPIRAYAIKQGAISGGVQADSVQFSSLDLGNSPPLKAKQSVTNFDTYRAIADKEQLITLSVDYAEFTDGTQWGPDAGKSGERSAGQRAGAASISRRLLEILNGAGLNDVMRAVESNTLNVEPPANRSETWKEGFRSGSNSVMARLKSVRKRAGLAQVEENLRQLAERFKGAN